MVAHKHRDLYQILNKPVQVGNLEYLYWYLYLYLKYLYLCLRLKYLFLYLNHSVHCYNFHSVG